MSSTPLQSGDTFPIKMLYLSGFKVDTLENGYMLLCCVYDSRGNLLAKGTTEDGRITKDDSGWYYMNVKHSESEKMVGKCSVQVTVVATDGTLVDHADEPMEIQFDARPNNKYIPESQSIYANPPKYEDRKMLIEVGENLKAVRFMFPHEEPQAENEPSESYNNDFNNDF